MNIENLCQFNSNLFLKMLGNYIQLCRNGLRLSIHEVSVKTHLSTEKLEQIEKGQYLLNDAELMTIIDRLSLDQSEIMNMAKITQVQEIIQVTRELNANFPG